MRNRVRGGHMLKAGVIGLGQIGGFVASGLAASKLLAAVYDVRSDAADKLEGVPALSARPAEVARVADVIFIAVVSADQAREALAGPGGVFEQARPGMEIVLQSTVS